MGMAWAWVSTGQTNSMPCPVVYHAGMLGVYRAGQGMVWPCGTRPLTSMACGTWAVAGMQHWQTAWAVAGMQHWQTTWAVAELASLRPDLTFGAN